MREYLQKHKTVLVILSIFLCVLLIIISVISVIFAGNSDGAVIAAAPLSENSEAVFQNTVHVALPSDRIDKHLKKVVMNEQGEYMLCYSSELPDFFRQCKENDVFCAYPNEKSKNVYFKKGFCGKVIEKSEEAHTVTFVLPQISEVFQKLKFSTANTGTSGAAFYPTEAVESYTVLPLQANTLSATNDAGFSLGNTDVDFKYQQNNRASIDPEYQILCKQLKIKLKHKLEDGFEMNGSITLDYPSVKMMLDYECNNETGETVINDYVFDFLTKEKMDFVFKGKKEAAFPSPKQKIGDYIPVDIVDVTENESGKRVLGTYVIGYNVKLPDIMPVSPNNTTNDVGYLSLGIALQLAVTAKGEIEISCSYKQAGTLCVYSSAKGETGGTVKGYDYPHPVLESTAADGSRAQEVPAVTSTYKGSVSLNAGVSVDVGICILGMIPIKLTNGIEANLDTGFEYGENKTSLEKETLVENSYVVKQDDVTFSVDVYSDLKMYLGAKLKPVGKGGTVSLGAEIQIFRKSLLRIPAATDFTVEQCRIGGVQLGAVYSDGQLAETIAEYAKSCKDYSLLAYTKDAAINTALDKAVSELGMDTEEFLEELQLDYPSGKLDCYASGALFIRDSKDKVVAIVLFGDDFRNDIGLHSGMKLKDIEQMYSVPDKRYTMELEIGALAELFIGKEINNVDLQAQIYNDKEDLCCMEVYAASDTSQILILKSIVNS